MRSTRLLHMQEGRAHVFTRANPWREGNTWGLPQHTVGDYVPAYGISVPWNPWIGQSFRTALFWAKAGWPIRRYGWKDREIVWRDALYEGDNRWIPTEDDQFVEDWMIGGNGEAGGGDPGVDPFLTIYTRVEARQLEVRCSVNKGDYPDVTFKVLGKDDITVAMGAWALFEDVSGSVTVTAVSKDLIETVTVEVPLFPAPTSPYWFRGVSPLRYHFDKLNNAYYRHLGTMERFSFAVSPPLYTQGTRKYPSGITEVSDAVRDSFLSNITPFGIMSYLGVKFPSYTTGIALPDLTAFSIKTFKIWVEDEVYEYPVTFNSEFSDQSQPSITVGRVASAYNLPRPQPVMFDKYKAGQELRWQMEFHV